MGAKELVLSFGAGGAFSGIGELLTGFVDVADLFEDPRPCVEGNEHLAFGVGRTIQAFLIVVGREGCLGRVIRFTVRGRFPAGWLDRVCDPLPNP